jgi:L-fuculose-phosphate aldolase
LSTKSDLIRFSKLCYRNNFLSATDGNLSVRINGKYILTTASNTCKGNLTQSDIIKVTIEGKPVAGRKIPTTEFKLHRFIYEKRPHIKAVIHTHPVFATAFAVAGFALDKMVFPEIIIKLNKIPLADYGSPATDELPRSIEKYVKDYDAVLLQNHGLVTYGSSLEDAYFKTEKIEHIAAISFYSRLLGGEKELTESQIEKLRSHNL